MNKSIKKAICILQILILILSLAACDSSGSSSINNTSDSTTTVSGTIPDKSVSTTVSKGIINITMTLYASWVKPGLEAMVKRINDNPKKYGVNIIYDKIPDTVNQGLPLLKARYATDQIPDIQLFASAKTIKAEFGKQVDYMDLSGDWKNMYDPEIIKSNFFSYEGKLIAAPYGSISVGAMLYNKKVFNRLGLSIPLTWPDFLAICEKIKASNITPIFISAKEDWTVQLWPMLGFMREFSAVKSSAMMENLNKNKDKYATKELFIDSMNKEIELKAKGYFNKTMMSDTYANAQKALVDGTAAMYCMGTWVMDEIKASYPDKISDIGAFAIPFDGNDALPLWMPWTMLVPAVGKNAEICKKIVMELSSKESQQLFFNIQPGIPLAKGLNMSQIQLSDAQKEKYAIFTTPGRGYTEFGNLSLYGQGDNFTKNNQELLIGAKTAQQVSAGVDADVARKAIAARDINWLK